MKAFQVLFALALILLTMLSCGSPKTGADALTGKGTIDSYKPSATDLSGAPMMMSGSTFQGKCAFRYMDGHNSTACDAVLNVSQTQSSVSLALRYKIDGKQNQTNPVLLAIGTNNLLYDYQHTIVGNIGSAALRFQNTDIGLMSVHQMPDSTLAVLVQQVPGMNGDSLTNGFSFVSSMK